MSPALKAELRPGSLGYSTIERKPEPAKVAEDGKVAREWKLDGLKSAAKNLLDASKTLSTEVENDAKYWEGVFAIREDGWLVTRMPRMKNVLGVRYGFAEAAKQFVGISALKRNADGSVLIDDVDTSITGCKSGTMLRVRVIKDGEAVGVSTQHTSSNDGSVRDMIRRARNFIYEAELFFEIMKEARSCAGQGMRTNEDSAMVELGDGMIIVLDMVYLTSSVSRRPILTIIGPRRRHGRATSGIFAHTLQ